MVIQLKLFTVKREWKRKECKETKAKAYIKSERILKCQTRNWIVRKDCESLKFIGW